MQNVCLSVLRTSVVKKSSVPLRRTGDVHRKDHYDESYDEHKQTH